MIDMVKKKRQAARMNKITEQERDAMISRMARLNKMTNSPAAGWQDFFDLLGDYIEACKRRKTATRIDIASPEMIEQLKLLDREIYILEFVRQIPMKYVNKVENMIEREKKRESTVKTESKSEFVDGY